MEFQREWRVLLCLILAPMAIVFGFQQLGQENLLGALAGFVFGMYFIVIILVYTFAEQPKYHPVTWAAPGIILSGPPIYGVVNNRFDLVVFAIPAAIFFLISGKCARGDYPK